MAQPTRDVLFSDTSLLEKSTYISANWAGISILSVGGWLFPGRAQANAKGSWLPQCDCSLGSLYTQPPAIRAAASRAGTSFYRYGQGL